MGREIRMVPPGWEHPRRDCPHSPWAGGCSESKRSWECRRCCADLGPVLEGQTFKARRVKKSRKAKLRVVHPRVIGGRFT